MNNKVRNDLDYDLDDIRYELAQICAVMQYITDAAFDITPATKEIDNVRCSLRLITDVISRTHSRLEVLTGFA